MKIHGSHSKKDLLDFIVKNNINIESCEKYNKKLIVQKLESYNFEDINVEYLTRPNQLKSLTVKQKNNIMNKSKQIISLYKNGFMYEHSFFKDKEHLLKVGNEISDYGDIPSVRRAIKMINEKYKDSIECEISENVQEQLKNKQKIKEFAKPVFNVKYGKFKIEF